MIRKKLPLLLAVGLYGFGVQNSMAGPEVDHPVHTCRVQWNTAPRRTPSRGSVDAPVLGNGDMGVCLGPTKDGVRLFLSKNDFWYVRSRFRTGTPKVVGWLDIRAADCNGRIWKVTQDLFHPRLHGTIGAGGSSLGIEAWLAATENVLVVRLEAAKTDMAVSLNLSPAVSSVTEEETGTEGAVSWVERRFEKAATIPTAVTAAMRVQNGKLSGGKVVLKPGRPVTVLLSMQSRFKVRDQRAESLRMCRQADVDRLWREHRAWWETYWNRSWVKLDDRGLEQFYYLSLYTLGASIRDPEFPPGIFGTWVTTDSPQWNGDYHLNYNYQAPFYPLVGSNRLEQARCYDRPLFDFIERARWYARNVTGTRGVLYPVGIGPKGVEPHLGGPHKSPIKEKGGLFFQQRSNAAYAVVNMARYWRCTLDPEYAETGYPFVRDVALFWEDYLKFEERRYVIYNDAVHEGSGNDFNSIVSLALVRNTFETAMEMAKTLGRDQDHFEKWQHILANLSGFATQEKDGRKVFRYTERGTAWWKSNTLGIQHIYPGNAIGLDSPKELLDIARNTLEVMGRWRDHNGTNSFYPAAVRIGYDAEVILENLRDYAGRMCPNGFRGANPHGIENCSTVPNTINEMLCMGHGYVLRVFPVWPKSGKARFGDLRTWGAFLVSAEIADGQVQYVRVLSERGRECAMVNPWPGRKSVLHRKGGEKELLSGERFQIPTTPGEILLLGPEGTSADDLRLRVQRSVLDIPLKGKP